MDGVAWINNMEIEGGVETKASKKCPSHGAYQNVSRLKLSGSHRSTHVASNLALQAVASQAKLQRQPEPQAVPITGCWKYMSTFCSAGQHRRIFAGALWNFFVISEQAKGFRIACKQKNFRIAINLGVCDSNCITHHGGIA